MRIGKAPIARDRRLILNTGGGLREIDARTGQPIVTFGRNGFVDMRTGDPRRLAGPHKSPVRIFENLAIVGSNPGEGYGSPPGDLRAYDVVTGNLVWTFHTIPRPGEFGYDTWPPDAWKYAGGANTWGEITVDAKNSLVFFPTGSPTHDLYGADRAGNNLFGNCLLALDARTGRRVWHFQTVHHDLWDYDLTAAPKLLTIRDPSRAGATVDIVALAGKTGYLYVFERQTGRPIWPIEEKPVPQSGVPGERSSPTQPIPSKPPPFARQTFRPEDVNPFVSPEEQDRLKQAVRDSANAGVFTPSSHERYHIQLPGAWGGANWGSLAADPSNGSLFVRSLEMPSYRKMSLVNETPSARQGQATLAGGAREQQGYTVYTTFCAACHGPGQAQMKSPAKLGLESFRRLLRRGKSRCRHSPMRRCRPRASRPSKRISRRCPLAEGEQAGDGVLRFAAANPNRYRRTIASVLRIVLGRAGTRATACPAVGPPWTQLVAYDLNTGTIKWRVPDGQAPGLAAKGHHGYRHRASAKRSGRDRRRPRVHGELAGPDAARLRQRHRTRAVGARARGESRRDSRGLSDRRPAVSWRLPRARRGAPAAIRCGRTPFTGSRDASKRRGTTFSRCRPGVRQ